ncbi:hypothetical protein [Pseudovibrio sp. POLY-S9]|uniref:hypothetical protein n=1 Tax=Pseudovibrio sp. POLY-S9 TaxID=1576596 RepID=UPI00070AD677|nr:hypothetical protein [Pseudovibrio sp. POLY-S9]
MSPPQIITQLKELSEQASAGQWFPPEPYSSKPVVTAGVLDPVQVARFYSEYPMNIPPGTFPLDNQHINAKWVALANPENIIKVIEFLELKASYEPTKY